MVYVYGCGKKSTEFFFTSTADYETSEKELETCYESSDSSENEDGPQSGS